MIKSCIRKIMGFLCYRGLLGLRKCKLPFREWYANLGELRSLVQEVLTLMKVLDFIVLL